MSLSPPECSKTSATISVAEYHDLAREWIIDGELRHLSGRTISERREILDKFFWFLDQQGLETVAVRELKKFFHYLHTGHEEPGGRFGNPRLTKALRPISLKGWHVVLSAWHRWMVSEDYLTFNPMSKVPAPIVREEVKQPLSVEQVRRLLAAARRSQQAKRDEALILFLADTGVRVTELIKLKIGDVDFHSRMFKVVGKGEKVRQGYFGSVTTKALKAYCKPKLEKRNLWVFESERGSCGGIGDPLTRSGVQQILTRLARSAGIKSQVSPHQFRRFASVEFLRSGGSVFALQNLLGHSTLAMTRRYCALAQADVEAQHRQFSPADRLR